jgi:hypothetical protein
LLASGIRAEETRTGPNIRHVIVSTTVPQNFKIGGIATNGAGGVEALGE